MRFVEQAKQRIVARGLLVEWVERTVERPEFVRASLSRPARKSAFRRIEELGGRWLRVVFEEVNGEILVVSVYVDHKAEKQR